MIQSAGRGPLMVDRGRATGYSRRYRPNGLDLVSKALAAKQVSREADPNG
jgi:hypothetical protein